MAVKWMMLLMPIALMFAGCNAQSTASDSNTQRVTISGRAFELELALDDESRYKGLGGRESIAEDGGMLFVFPEPKYTSFVMRDCLVPIDLIFLGPNGEIVAMHEMQVEPPHQRSKPRTWYSSDKYVQFAIELKGGTLDELNLQVGDRIELPFEELKRRAR